MKHLTNFFLLLLFVSLFTNCSPKTTETYSMVSPNPPSIDVGTFWIGSSRNHSYSDKVGAISMNGFYAVNSKDELKKDDLGNLMFYATDSPSDLEFFDSEIENLNYEEGNFYQVKGSKHYLGSELVGISVDEVLQTIEDSYYEKIEEKIIFIAPETVNCSSHGQRCLQVQYDTYSRSGEWIWYYRSIDGFKYEEGYLYKLKIKRTHWNKIDAEATNMIPKYSDELITIYKKQRMS